MQQVPVITNDLELIGILSEEIHNLWVDWSVELCKREKITLQRQKSWSDKWLAYNALHENTKRKYRNVSIGFLRRMESHYKTKLISDKRLEYCQTCPHRPEGKICTLIMTGLPHKCKFYGKTTDGKDI